MASETLSTLGSYNQRVRRRGKTKPRTICSGNTLVFLLFILQGNLRFLLSLENGLHLPSTVPFLLNVNSVMRSFNAPALLLDFFFSPGFPSIYQCKLQNEKNTDTAAKITSAVENL